MRSPGKHILQKKTGLRYKKKEYPQPFWQMHLCQVFYIFYIYDQYLHRRKIGLYMYYCSFFLVVFPPNKDACIKTFECIVFLVTVTCLLFWWVHFLHSLQLVLMEFFFFIRVCMFHSVWLCVCVSLCVCLCSTVYVCVGMCVCLCSTQCECVHVYVFHSVYVYVPLCLCVCARTCLHVYVFHSVCVRVPLCVSIYFTLCLK